MLLQHAFDIILVLFVIQVLVGRIVITESHSTLIVTSDKFISLLERCSDKTPPNAKMVLVDFPNKKGTQKLRKVYAHTHTNENRNP